MASGNAIPKPSRYDGNTKGSHAKYVFLRVALPTEPTKTTFVPMFRDSANRLYEAYSPEPDRDELRSFTFGNKFERLQQR